MRPSAYWLLSIQSVLRYANVTWLAFNCFNNQIQVVSTEVQLFFRSMWMGCDTAHSLTACIWVKWRRSTFLEMLASTTLALLMWVNQFFFILKFFILKLVWLFYSILCLIFTLYHQNWSRSPFFKDQLKITDKGTSVTTPFPIPSEISNAVIQPVSETVLASILQLNISVFIIN